MQVFIEEKREYASRSDLCFEDLIKRDLTVQGRPSKPFVDVPELVCDVTIPVNYCLDTGRAGTTNQGGLTLSGSKQSLIGFFNPIPPCLEVEHERPTLCIVYKTNYQQADDKVSEITIAYYSEKQKV